MTKDDPRVRSMFVDEAEFDWFGCQTSVDVSKGILVDASLSGLCFVASLDPGHFWRA